MKTGFKRSLTFVMALFMLVFVLVGCGSTGTGNSTKDASSGKQNAASGSQTGDSSSQKPVTLVFWDQMFSTDSEKVTNQDDLYIHQAISRFEKENTNIKVDYESVTQDLFQLINMFKTAAATNTGPDMIILYPGNFIFDMKNYLIPLDKYFTKDELDATRYSVFLREGFKEDGALYGIPYEDAGQSAVFYNKGILKKVGLDYDKTPPKTVDNWISDMKKIKDAGYIPWELGLKSGAWLGVDAASVWYAQLKGGTQEVTKSFLDLNSGKVKFSEDNDFKAVWSKVAGMFKDGLINKDCAVLEDSADSMPVMLQGKAAFRTDFTWNIGSYRDSLGADMGMMKIPDFKEGVPASGAGVGGAAMSIHITATCKNPEAGVKFVKFLTSEKEQREFASKNGGFISTLKAIDSSIYKDSFIKQQAEWAQSGNAILFLDSTINQDLFQELGKQEAVYISGKQTYEQFVNLLDQKVALINKH